MGNKQSKSKEDKVFLKNIKKTATKTKNIAWMVDHIATKFILTTEFQKLLELQDKTNCSKFTILTKNLLTKRLSPKEILYLDFRTKKGNIAKILTRDDFAFIDNESLAKVDINNIVKKNRICIGIAEFYVRFFHLFASIVKVINPIYRFKDSDGNVVEVDLLDKSKIPSGTKKKRHLMGLCKDRYKTLLPVQNNENGMIVVGKFCQEDPKSLCEEPGILELKKLYFDEYDYDPDSPTAGTYYKMSESMKEKYESDVKAFYVAFTGEVSAPDDIKDFCDIRTLDVTKLDGCLGNSKYNSFKGPQTNPSLKKYGAHLRKMLATTKQNQEKLIDILNEMFHYDVDRVRQTKELIIHPQLTVDSLKILIEKTRNIIMSIYIQCEADYKTGIKLFRALSLDQRLTRETSRINMHKRMKEKLMMQEDIVKPQPQEPPIEDTLITNQQVEAPLPQVQESQAQLQETLPEGLILKEPVLEEPPIQEPLPEGLLLNEPVLQESVNEESKNMVYA